MFLDIDKDNIGEILLCVAVILLNVYIWSKMLYRAIKGRKEALEELKKPVSSTPVVSQKAKILSKNAYIDYTNHIKIPEHKTMFKVVFLVGKSSKEFEVDKKVFDKISEKDVGILITNNGRFYDFQKR